MPEENLLKQLSALNLSGFVDSNDITNISRLKVAICGEPKTGKSYVIAKTARKPVLVYDFDDRVESIAGIPGVLVKTLVDTTDTDPKAWNALESDAVTMEYLAHKGQLPFQSIALDSITFLRKYAEHQLLKDSTGVTRTKVRVGVVDYLIPKDWDSVTGVQKMLETMLSRFFSMGVDVYATFHTRPEKDASKSTKTDFVYKDTLTVDPPNLKMLLPKFNDQWRTKYTDNKYMLQLKPDWQFNASTVLKNVGEWEEANIEELLRKHTGAKK